MANPEHLAILKQGVEVWNRWKRQLWNESQEHPDLSDADLTHSDLPHVDFSFMDLSRTTLTGAELSWADMEGTDAGDAEFSDADLRGANFKDAVIPRASLRGAILLYTFFDMTDLDGADLSGAQVGNSYFLALDLQKVVGLERIRHYAPSSVDIDTLVKSKGKVPHRFLFSAGVPPMFVVVSEAVAEATSNTQFHSCFISYSARDEVFAGRLYSDLQSEGEVSDQELRGADSL